MRSSSKWTVMMNIEKNNKEKYKAFFFFLELKLKKYILYKMRHL